ncbi:hypothetical protein [Salinicola aestuarinus]|uniref:hypothetical protein n=1 Tax=Salinicola aestuarinus TaxID=1949082 RepID=UPI000DA22BB1|nr:hypothetical protein [Salinicola aestuarinus]
MSHAFGLSRPLRCSALFFVISCLAAGIAQASDTPKGLRGTITEVSDNSMAVESLTDGRTRRVIFNDHSLFFGASEASLDAIKDGAYVNTVERSDEGGGPPTAVAVNVFSDAITKKPFGYYTWETPRSALSESDAGADADTAWTLTSGTVVESARDGGTLTVTVDYQDGSNKIRVPDDVATVAMSPATRDALKPGASVFVGGDVSEDPMTAMGTFVSLDGTPPPM